MISLREMVSFVKDAPSAHVKTSLVLAWFMNLKGRKDWDVSFTGFISFYSLQLNLSACAWAW